MAFIHVAILAGLIGYEVRMGLIVCLGVGGLFLVIGRTMTRVPRNGFVGVRTPWTMSSQKSWDKTHQQASWMFTAIGAATIQTGVSSSQYALVLCIGLAIGGSVWLVVYSYLVWREDTRKPG
jgi:uncharacterized membrane protein